MLLIRDNKADLRYSLNNIILDFQPQTEKRGNYCARCFGLVEARSLGWGSQNLDSVHVAKGTSSSEKARQTMNSSESFAEGRQPLQGVYRPCHWTNEQV